MEPDNFTVNKPCNGPLDRLGAQLPAEFRDGPEDRIVRQHQGQDRAFGGLGRETRPRIRLHRKVPPFGARRGLLAQRPRRLIG